VTLRLFISFVMAWVSGAAFGQEAPKDPELAVPGVRIRTKDGTVVEGVTLPGAPAESIWIKNVSGTFVLPAADVAGREETTLDLRRVYPPEEVLGILMGRIQPSTPEDFERLGRGLLRVKLEERAVAAFRMAETLRRPSGGESRLQIELVRLRDRIEDLALRRTVYGAQESCLTGDYDAAIAQIAKVEQSMGGTEAALFLEIRRLRAQVEDGRGRAHDAQLVEETWRTIEALLKLRAMGRDGTLASAVSFVTERMPQEVRARVNRRFNFTPEDASSSAAWDRRPEEPLQKHSCDEASWYLLRPDARDPESWWAGATDVSRYKLLKGLYVARHLGPVRAVEKNCPRCGGSGLVDEVACPECSGLKVQQVLFYR
jgi:hypothetical protein